MSTFKPESRGNTEKSLNKSYSFVQDHKLCTCNSSCQEFLHDTKWWLNHGKGYPHDQINMLEPAFPLFGARYFDGNEKVIGENPLIEEYCVPCSKTSAAICLNNQLKNSYSHAINDQDIWLQELESIADESLQMTPISKNTEEIWLSNAHLMRLDSGDCPVFEQAKKHSSDLDSRWTELRNIEPWWNSVDKDVASLASQRSSSHFRNRDFPKPQTFQVEKRSDGIKCCDLVKEQMENKRENISHLADCTLRELASERDVKGVCVADCTRGNFISVNTDISLGKLGLKGYLLQGSIGTLSSNDGSGSAKIDSSDTAKPTNVDLSKRQLLEALCHSQTLAREAEKLAQEAFAEKDHVIDLFFRQASYLFAYKQWLKILQIEALCLHLGSKSQPSVVSPILLPGICGKSSVLRNNRRKISKKKSGKRRCYLCKCAVAFAVGLTLAGTGLLVGWTIGWLFRSL